jgi:hypothetical protein
MHEIQYVAMLLRLARWRDGPDQPEVAGPPHLAQSGHWRHGAGARILGPEAWNLEPGTRNLETWIPGSLEPGACYLPPTPGGRPKVTVLLDTG